MLKFCGIGESLLEDELLELIDHQTDPTIATYAKEGEVTVRLSTKQADDATALTVLDACEAQIRARVGEYLYAREEIALEEAVVRLLRSAGQTLSCAESLSGGLFAELVTSVPGSSGEFAGGVVTYTNAMKHTLLGIPFSQLEGADSPGAVSASTAAMMAERVRTLTGSDFAVSLTGVAGPAASEGKPIGLVYVGIAAPGQAVRVRELHLTGGRSSIRIRAVKNALYELWRALQHK
jgi:nicotinamide-nucleotide amidase